MFATIYKNDIDDYTIMGAYYKGIWNFERKFLEIYLLLMEIVQRKNRADFGVITDEEKNEIVDTYNVAIDDLNACLSFVIENKMPAAATFNPLYLYKNLNHKQNGIITPPTPIIEVTNKCNYNCRFCYIPELTLKDTMTLDELRNNIVIPFLKWGGLRSWCLSGGEPSCDKERLLSTVSIIVEESKKYFDRKPEIHMLTNGYKFTEYAQEYKEKGITAVQISLTSPLKEVENALRRPPKGVDSHQQAIDGARAAVKNGFITEINMILQPNLPDYPSNIDQIPEMIKLAVETGVHLLRLIPVVPTGKAYKNDIWMSIAEYRKIKEIVKKEKAKLPKESKLIIDCPIEQEIEKDRTVFCRAGTLFFYINTRGITYPCNNLQNEESRCYKETCKEVEATEIWCDSNLLNELRDYKKKSICDECINCNTRVECAGECRALVFNRYKTYDLETKPKECFRDMQ